MFKKSYKNKNGGFYPYPIGYIPHYIGKINEKPLAVPKGEEIVKAGLFSYEELKNKDFGGRDLVNFLIEEKII